jgi:hypothetical protein
VTLYFLDDALELLLIPFTPLLPVINVKKIQRPRSETYRTDPHPLSNSHAVSHPHATKLVSEEVADQTISIKITNQIITRSPEERVLFLTESLSTAESLSFSLAILEGYEFAWPWDD